MSSTEIIVDTMLDEQGCALFAFQDLDYVPFGFSSDTAPYIETPIATMRAAATLMRLDIVDDDPVTDEVIPSSLPTSGRTTSEKKKTMQVQTVICDLGCGDGELPIGVGVDYDAELIKVAGLESSKQAIDSQWIIYDFNADLDDIVAQLLDVHKVTHVFVGLVNKQLALPTVRSILTRLCQGGAVVCCYKYHPLYLTPVRRDEVMNLVVYDATSVVVTGVKSRCTLSSFPLSLRGSLDGVDKDLRAEEMRWCLCTRPAGRRWDGVAFLLQRRQRASGRATLIQLIDAKAKAKPTD
ncbi:hypothetical protein K504DRAFT_492521 [Pleomassaria siparia CBS 279.74]|uniref:Methyltransferase domain-containing protein n=1 Tax=Pleomassaria siparia CBS 279.74 TaxID=1314801 RepID=A0A6G1K585_9PLEO|nr:hypothetical protein K504DRAFT_492521 [Pleomassaria siparia CBS 279.74]